MNTSINPNTAHPNFGMAYRQQTTKEGVQKFLEYTGIANSSVKQRGFRQFVKEQAALKRFDTEFIGYDFLNGGMRIIDNKTGMIIVDMFRDHKDTGLSRFGSVNSPGKKLIAWLFNPKQFLPQAIVEAGNEAKRLEQEAIKAEKINEGIGRLV